MNAVEALATGHNQRAKTAWHPWKFNTIWTACVAALHARALGLETISIWRYRDLLPIPKGFEPDLPVGFTPLVRAKTLGKRIGAANLYIKNDAVCFPSLSFKDRVVAVALANAQAFGFDVVGCSSTGNLANAVAAQAARLGLKACIMIPADLEAAKVINTQVYGGSVGTR